MYLTVNKLIPLKTNWEEILNAQTDVFYTRILRPATQSFPMFFRRPVFRPATRFFRLVTRFFLPVTGIFRSVTRFFRPATRVLVYLVTDQSVKKQKNIHDLT